ncbi:MAG: L,D-transpeptidase family protein, partial [Panacibacter sp.]
NSSSKNSSTSQETSDTDTTTSKTEPEKKVSKRDYSITAANAYNNIFMDSLDMESFIASGKVNDSMSQRLRSFYNARNYQYAWFSDSSLNEQARSFWNMQGYYADTAKTKEANYKVLKGLMGRYEVAENLEVTPQNKDLLKTELLLTEHFILHVLSNYEEGVVKRKEMERFIPIVKTDALQMADSLLTQKHKDNKYYEDGNPMYKALKEKLQLYTTAAKAGGWPVIASTATRLKMGSSSAGVLKLKKRLQATGDMQADTTTIYNAALDAAVKQYQASLGLTPDGKINVSLLKDLNVTAVQRVEQLLINLGRLRWMPEAEGNLFMVNIPEFKLNVFEGAKKVFNMNVVVGKEGHNTMMFKGIMNQVVFSPYWNIPADIVEKEIYPAMKRNPGYLKKHNMEVTGNNAGMPVVRQLPGEENSLGKVKFLFPNSFDIYFHDTPAKNLFSKDKRAFSHGCIRLAEAEKLAGYVLQNNPDWPPVRITEAMNSGKETFVKLNKPVPVIITYYTAWVDENGVLNFRDDIYGNDQVIAKKMFASL